MAFIQFFLGIGAFIAGWIGYATTEASWVCESAVTHVWTT